MHKSVVLIPTYNEADSILQLINDLRNIDIDIIVIDDDSPDQTSQLVKNLHYAHVRVIDNGAKKGIGMAYKSGFNLALQDDYEFVATMDADG
jgi:dolichol-phosphate mannosyltransferase